MPRRVQDIIPNGRRSIRDIPLHESETPTRRSKEKEVAIKIHKPNRDKVVGNLISYEQQEPARKKHRRSGTGLKILLIFIGSIVAIGIIGYFASQFYAIATFDIVPKSYPIKVSKTVVAQANSTTGSVTYDIITISDTATVSVPSTNGAYQETKSTGKMIVYNDYSSAAQRLIAGTRLATANGLVYKLTSSITVPGKTTKGAGQITVSVIADKAGQEYNLSKSKGDTLRLLGFKGTPKYDGFYAKASTDISGGFAGTKKNISAANMSSSTKAITAQLLATLSARIHGEIKEDHIFFDQGLLFSTSSVLIGEKDDKTSTITITGTAHAIVFDKTSLFKELAGDEVIDSFEEYSFDIPNIENLSISFTNLKDFSVSKKNTLLSNIEGDITIVARIPTDEIKAKLIGLPLSDTYKIIREYSAIVDESSRGQVMPPWSKVPTSVDNIDIRIAEVK